MGQEWIDFGDGLGVRLGILKEVGIFEQFFWHVRRIRHGDFEPDSEPVKLRSEDECWPWPKQKNAAGYGVLNWLGYQFLAHRVAFELAYGPLRKPEIVCHHCDNPPCCNPLHLYAGDHKANARDRWQRTGKRRHTTPHEER